MTVKFKAEIDVKIIRKVSALMGIDIPSDEKISKWLVNEQTIPDAVQDDKLEMVFASIILLNNHDEYQDKKS
jgi:hypothetical protein